MCHLKQWIQHLNLHTSLWLHCILITASRNGGVVKALMNSARDNQLVFKLICHCQILIFLSLCLPIVLSQQMLWWDICWHAPLTHLFLSFFNDSTVIEMHNDSKRWQTRHLVAINIKQTISVQTVQLNDGHPGGRKWVGGSMGRWERQKIVTWGGRVKGDIAWGG